MSRALALGLLAALLCAGSASATPSLSLSTPQPIDAGTPLSSVSCPSESLCVAVDRAGHALTSSSPGTGAWSAPQAVDGAQPISAISCPSSALCVAVDEAGQAVTIGNPGPLASWSTANIDPGNRLRSVSCTGSLCVAVDEAGRALSTLSPGSPAAWSPPAAIPGAGHLRAVSCTGASSCVAVDEAGVSFASENPAAGGGSWRPRPLGGVLSAVSCFAGGCLVAAGGDVLASADPFSPNATWSTTPVTGAHATSVSCTSAGLCVAVDDGGAAFASIRAAGGVPEWSATAAPGASSMTGVSCLSGGLCVAVDATGRALTARVPSPFLATAAPPEIKDTTAALAGVVDPLGAVLADCHLEYGTSTAYGGVVPCAQAPSATGGAQQVTAQVQGLEANTTYHYRVVAASAGGTSAGADQTFTTAVSSGVQLIVPHPSISGTPASGQRLACHTGIADPGNARISYAWLRDLLPIPNATASTYVVKNGDAGFHIQCQVTAANAGGTVTAKSGFVTVPVQGVPAAVGETAVGRAQVRGRRVSVPVRCSSQASGGCQVLARVSVVETVSGGRVVAVSAGGARARAAAQRRTVTIAGVRVHLGRGERRTLVLSLNRTGRSLVGHRRSLPATLTVSGTVIGVIEASLAQERIVLGAATRSASRHRGARAH